MSLKIKIYELKDDGWYWNDETEDMDKIGITEHERGFFEDALLTLFNEAEDYKAFNEGNNAQRKALIRKHLKRTINDLEDALNYDLEHAVKIYPLIKKKVVE